MAGVDGNYDYESMSREELIKHVRAMKLALHLVRHEVQKIDLRLTLIERVKRIFAEEKTDVR